MKFTKSEEAAAPVIGTLLMISVVVVLAAIVGSIVLGVVGSQGTGQNVGITAVQGNYGSIVFTIHGGMDLRAVTAIDLIKDNTIVNCTGASPKVGDSCTVWPDRNGRTVMVATFADGSKQLVFDKNWGSTGGGDFGTGSVTKINSTYYHFTITTGPKSDLVQSWYFLVTASDTGLVSTYSSGTGFPGPVDNDQGPYADWSRAQLILNINGGGTVTLFDQTFS